jgi:hypothetical protein
MDAETREELPDADLEEQEGDLLPEREQMSVIDLGDGGGLAPPPTDVAGEPPMEETPPITPDQPPTE